MRTTGALIAAALTVASLAGCSRHQADEEAPPAEADVAPAPVPAPPPPVAPPAPVKIAVPKPVADLPPPAPEADADQQVQDDAAATGMTARIGEDAGAIDNTASTASANGD